MKRDLGDAPLTIGGWLIFIGIRFFVVTMVIGSDAVRTLHMKFNALQLLFILLFIYTFIVLVFFSKRHKAFPVTYIIIESLLLLRSIISLIVNLKSSNVNVILAAAIPVAIGGICIAYIFLSERVKKTFVCYWNEKPDQRFVDKANGIPSID